MSEHARPYDERTGDDPNPLAEVHLTCSCEAVLRIEGANRLYPSTVGEAVKRFLKVHRRHKPQPKRAPTMTEKIIDSFNQPLWYERRPVPSPKRPDPAAEAQPK